MQVTTLMFQPFPLSNTNPPVPRVQPAPCSQPTTLRAQPLWGGPHKSSQLLRFDPGDGRIKDDYQDSLLTLIEFMKIMEHNKVMSDLVEKLE